MYLCRLIYDTSNMNALDFLDLVKRRQSDRGYKPIPVEKEKLDRCIEAARLSPSACNAQPWKFIVVDEPELKEKVAKLMVSKTLGFNHFSHQCPVLVIVVREAPNFTSKVGMVLKDKPYTTMDVGIATIQFCLQAKAEGLGTCIVGWFNEKAIKKLLGIPKSKQAELIISLGYPSSDEVREKIRKKTEDIVSYNKY